MPYNLRKEMIEMVHSSDLGIEGCLRWARDVYCLPRMNSELKYFILKCDIRNTFKPDQPREPLVPKRSHPDLGKKLAQTCSCLI